MRVAIDEYEGRSGQFWTVRPFLRRTDHLRPPVPTGPNTVELVRSRDGDTYGALRCFRGRVERELALDFLAAGAPTTPVAVDLVDDARLPPALVTSWAPGSSDLPLEQFRRFDDLGRLTDQGYRFTPARALRTVVALGQLLDTAAERGFVPVELSPDHLVYNRGSIRLVGIGRHLYRPAAGEIPDRGGMSAPTALLTGDDLPAGSTDPAAWRAAQIRALLRLVGWMTCGLAPGAWGPVDPDLRAYLIGYAGFAAVPALHSGSLADGLAYAAHQEEQQEGRRRLASAKAVVLFDAAACERQRPGRQSWVSSLRGQVLSATVAEVGEIIMTVQIDVQPGADPWPVKIGYEKTTVADLPPGSRIDLRQHYGCGQRLAVRIETVGRSSTGWPPVGATVVPGPGHPAEPQRSLPALAINPESVRLGLMVEHGPEVVAIAAVPPDDWTRPQATTLSGAGWLLISPDKLGTVTRRLAAHLPHARFVIAGRSAAATASLAGRRVDQVQPNAADPPVIAGRPATDLPYVKDEQLKQFARDVSDATMTRVAKRRSFAAGWALAWEPPDGPGRADPRTLLRFLDEQFDDTELLLRVQLLLNKPIFQHDGAQQIRANVIKAAPILGAVPPAGPLRDHLMKVLLTRSPEDLYDTARKHLLPVAPRLAQVYDPASMVNGRAMEEALRDPEGMERLGLLGRLATTLPRWDLARLLHVVSNLDDLSVRVLRDLPAASLRHLADRIDTSTFHDLLRHFAADDDHDLLNWYSPAAWDMLTDQRTRDAAAELGPGWPLVAERDAGGTVTPGVVLELAQLTGKEPRHLVRLLLALPAAGWPAVVGNTGLAATWLREFGDIDVAGPLEAFPDAARLVERHGARAVRAAHLAGLPAGRLVQICGLAAGLALDVDEVATALMSTDLTDATATELGSAAGTSWVRAKMARGATFRECVRWLATRPAAIRTWAVDGPGLARRVVGDLLGGDPAELGVTGADLADLYAALTTCPGLGQLLGRLIFPRQRLALLTLIAAHPRRDRWPALLDEPLATVLGDEDPAGCLDLILTDGIRVGHARTIRRRHLGPADRAVLRSLGPLAADLPDDQLADLLRVSHRYGSAGAVTAAIVAAHQPATPRIVAAWGPEWLSMLAGPRSDFVADALAAVDLAEQRPATVSAWLLAAGTNGLRCLRRHGERLLELVADLRPPAADVRLLDAVLSGPDWPSARLYKMIIRHGLPHKTWELTAHRLRQNWPENDILVELWCLPVGRNAA